MVATDSEKDKQSGHPPEQNTDLLDDEFEDTENTSSASYKPPAKDWDTALLVDCSARRLRIICKDYPGCAAKANKEQMYQHVLEAMSEEQQCDICTGGICGPTTHYFPPTQHPPTGWYRGPEGIFIPPPVVNPPASVPTTASVTSVPATSFTFTAPRRA